VVWCGVVVWFGVAWRGVAWRGVGTRGRGGATFLLGSGIGASVLDWIPTRRSAAIGNTACSRMAAKHTQPGRIPETCVWRSCVDGENPHPPLRAGLKGAFVTGQGVLLFSSD
jgi:hypothetical protein